MLKKILIRLGLAPSRHPLFADNWHYFKKLDYDRPLDEYEFVVFDTELTGLNQRRDEIVSMGAVRIRGLKIIIGETFYACIKPNRPQPKESTLIHRITPQQLENAPPLEEVLPQFLEYCGKSLLVGHFVGLDVAFVNRASLHQFGTRINNPCLDTIQLARTYSETQWQHYHDRFRMDISYNLAALSRRYGLPDFNLHNAYEDALQTAYLFVLLIKKLHTEGVVTLKDLFKAGQSWRQIF